MGWVPSIYVWITVVTVSAYEIEKPFGVLKLANSSYPNGRRDLDDSISYLPHPDDIPEDCKETGICEHVNNYPHELMDRLIAEQGHKFFFQIESMDPRESTRRSDSSKIDLCNFEKVDIIPRAVARKSGQYFYVVHKSTGPGSQGFVMERCVGKRDCRGIAIFEEGFQPTCYQKFSKRHLTVLNAKGEMEKIELDIPTCCSCLSTSAYHHFYVLYKKSKGATP